MLDCSARLATALRYTGATGWTLEGGGPMEEFGKHLVGVVFWLATFALFAVLGWKFWHGQWLRLIAGNNLVSDEEQKSPFQRALGRRMGVVMLCCCGSLAALAASSFVEAAGGPSAGAVSDALVAAGIAGIVASLHLGRSMVQCPRAQGTLRTGGREGRFPDSRGPEARPPVRPRAPRHSGNLPARHAGRGSLGSRLSAAFPVVARLPPLPRGGRTLLRRTRWVAPGPCRRGARVPARLRAIS